MPSEDSRTTDSAIPVFTTDLNEFESERVRLALEGPEWTVTPVELSHIRASLSRRLGRGSGAGSPSGVVIAPAARLADLSRRPLPLPVLALGPAALFDELPDGFCDDMIGGDWTAAELRYRLRRLTRPVLRIGRHLTVEGSRLESVDGAREALLTDPQRRVLEVLIRGGGAPVPRVTLRAAAFGAEREGARGPGTDRALDMLISRLRKKVAGVTPRGTEVPRILAHRGAGYSIDAR